MTCPRLGVKTPGTTGFVHLYAESWKDHPHALRGIFSGNVQSITEVQVELRGSPKRVKWAALHTYPAVGQVLRTNSSVTVVRGAGTTVISGC
ncbi:hypothetical protein Pth03_58750 [Planotetraspora thailandica]|uniref:Uncharacterized protein n=1 Tax=Planotetraspora thailandica TaxID=487172 RepID=A0A8J3XYN5_9ACTN|nr:hypothetical protein Pth03_58750 [Planotetraspora thailandica]